VTAAAVGGETAPATPRRTPVERWVAAATVGGDEVGADELLEWQLARVRETLERARRNSRFYARRLERIESASVRGLVDLARVPTTSADDLRRSGRQLLCVPSSQVERIVTLPTSGTTGVPKRVFFTARDLDSTVDFFAAGMSTFTGRGDRVLVLMPGPRPGSIGDLLRRAMPRLGAAAEVYGVVADPGDALAAVARLRPTVVVGIPVQVHTLVRHAVARGVGVIGVRAVLLSADRAPSVVRATIERAWGCRVFDHYGSTEMGYGGGVECEARDGYHLRAADLLFEVVRPDTGRPCGPGERGEVVVTTLRRTGMPLVRYRTGDVSALLTRPCRCGSRLPRLEAIAGRLAAGVDPDGDGVVGLAELDERLLGLDGVADYRAAWQATQGGVKRLEIRLRVVAGTTCDREGVRAAARRALEASPALAGPLAARRLELEIVADDGVTWPVSSGMTKRTLTSETEGLDA